MMVFNRWLISALICGIGTLVVATPSGYKSECNNDATAKTDAQQFFESVPPEGN